MDNKDNKNKIDELYQERIKNYLERDRKFKVIVTQALREKEIITAEQERELEALIY